MHLLIRNTLLQVFGGKLLREGHFLLHRHCPPSSVRRGSMHHLHQHPLESNFIVVGVLKGDDSGDWNIGIVAYPMQSSDLAADLEVGMHGE